MSLRVSGGRRLQSPPGALARPTAARVRLAVINRLAPRLAGCRWLDLCCGSGAMACEALHHGAALVVGVEQDRRIAAVARANLETVAAGQAPRPSVQVVTAEVLHWLTAPSPAGQGRGGRPASGRQAPFAVIYVDPPYASGLYGAIADAVREGGWLEPGGVMVWECGSRTVPETPNGWRLESCRRYGSTCVLYLELPVEQPLGTPHGAAGCAVEPTPAGSAAQGAAAAVLIPGGDEQTHQGDGDQAENDAAEKGFDHGSGPGRDAPCNSSMMEARPHTFPAQP